MRREVFVLLTFSFGALGLCCKAADPGIQAHPHLCFSSTTGPSWGVTRLRTCPSPSAAFLPAGSLPFFPTALWAFSFELQ